MPSKIVQLNPDENFHFEILRDLAIAPYGASDIGEVLVAASQIKPGDFSSFSAEFNQLADRVFESAERIDEKRFPVSARDAYFKAATYYRSADFYLHGNWEDERINKLWGAHEYCFRKAVSLLPIPAQLKDLPTEGFYVPTIFYSPDGSTKPKPTLILGNGFDGGQEEMYHMVGRAALDRGYNVITYDGPGQAGPRRAQNLGFIREWEKVVSPVVDYLFTKEDVDTDAICLVGFSLGGYFAPRAAAFEKRLRSCVCVDGLDTFGSIVRGNFGDEFVEMFERGDEVGVNRVVEEAMRDPGTSTGKRWYVEQGTWAFKATSHFDLIRQTMAMCLDDVTDLIPSTTAILVCDAENDIFFKGQGKVLADKLGGRATYHLFEDSTGAGAHCALGANIFQNQVILDWFQGLVDRQR